MIFSDYFVKKANKIKKYVVKVKLPVQIHCYFIYFRSIKPSSKVPYSYHFNPPPKLQKATKKICHLPSKTSIWLPFGRINVPHTVPTRSLSLQLGTICRLLDGNGKWKLPFQNSIWPPYGSQMETLCFSGSYWSYWSKRI